MLRRSLALVLLAAALLGTATCGGGGGGTPSAGDALEPVLAHLTPTSARIGWRAAEADPARLSYGPAGGTWTHRDLPAALEQDETLTGLQPGTTYRYRVEVAGTLLGAETVFETPTGAPDEILRFAVFGDSGTGLPPAPTIFANVAAEDPDLVWITGDCAYQSGTTREVRDNFSRPLAELRASTPLYPVLGNHDVITPGGRPLLDAAFLPTNPVTGTEHYYAVERGACLFVGLDSNRSLAQGSAQLTWLDQTLAGSAARWRFVFLHHTTYSSSNHGSSAALQASLAPVAEARDVDIVFCGHDHDYERTFPLVEGTPTGAASDPDYTDPAGPVWVVTGGGGARLYGAGTSTFTAYSDDVFHHVRVRVQLGRLDLDAVATDRSVFDRMSITKTP